MRGRKLGHIVTKETREKLSKANKGLIPWNKGKTGIYSTETIEKMIKPRLGKKHTVEHCRKISLGLMGRECTKETRDKISISNTGKKCSEETKKILSELNLGKTLSMETRKKMSISKTGHPTSEQTREKLRLKFTGRTFSAETLEKMRLANIKKGKDQTILDKIRKANTGKKHSKESIEKRVLKNTGKKRTKETCKKISQALKGRTFSDEWRAKQALKKKGPFRDSKPERMMQIALSLNGIKFVKHKPFKLGKSWHQVDIFIEPNICVEVDGIHWHLEDKEDIKRDLFINQELTVLGYHLIRIRDKDILKNTQNCAEKVVQLIKELHYHYPLKGD